MWFTFERLGSTAGSSTQQVTKHGSLSLTAATSQLSGPNAASGILGWVGTLAGFAVKYARFCDLDPGRLRS